MEAKDLDNNLIYYCHLVNFMINLHVLSGKQECFLAKVHFVRTLQSHILGDITKYTLSSCKNLPTL